MQAIETVYKGYRFRSRLEARWTVFFDTLGVRWEYEKEGYDLGAARRYLPDFWLPDLDAWIEIKGQEPTLQEEELASLLSRGTGKAVFLFFGDIRVPNPDGRDVGDQEGTEARYFSPRGFRDSLYYWCECPDCGAVGVQFEARSDRLPCKQCLQCSWGGPCDKHPNEPDEGCPRHSGNHDRGHNGASPRLVEAFTTARQARFEHGPNTRGV